MGHASALVVFGLPVVLYSAYLPGTVQRAAETLVGLVIVALSVLLLRRWRLGLYRALPGQHVHAVTRSGIQAYGIGALHGMGGTAGVGLLLLSGIHDKLVATAALGIFAVCTALSMTLLSTTFALALSTGVLRRSFERVAPALGGVSLAFGVWYACGAQGLVPYVF